MLRRPLRLDRATFTDVARSRRVLNGDPISIRFLCRPGEVPRASIVVSRKVAASAVGRNRCRRKISAALESVLEGSSLGVIVYARKGAPQASFQQLQGEIKRLIDCASAICK